MLISWWRGLRKSAPTSSRRNDLPTSRRPSFRPKLEVLEDRTLPAPLVYGIASEGTASAIFAPPSLQPVAIAASGARSGVQPISNKPPSGAANQTEVTVVENSTKSVIDLGPIFTHMSGIHPEDGLQLSLLGNTNPGLVKAELSEGELTLTYTPSRYGTATITVGATEADGSCVRENIVITVLPSLSAKVGGVSPIPVDQQMSVPPTGLLPNKWSM
jgi:hypothetical protein